MEFATCEESKKIQNFYLYAHRARKKGKKQHKVINVGKEEGKSTKF